MRARILLLAFALAALAACSGSPTAPSAAAPASVSHDEIRDGGGTMGNGN